MRMVYIEFVDPTYREGWAKHGGLDPTDAICVGCALEIDSSDDHVKLCMFTGKDEGYDGDVFSPALIPRTCIKVIEELKLPRRRKKNGERNKKDKAEHDRKDARCKNEHSKAEKDER